MLKAMLIDDEPLALRQLEKLLTDEGHIQVVAKLTDACEATRQVKELQPDVIFLDIHMSEIDGLETAEQILAECGKVDIVFVTAYNQYAVQAFELHAIDYLLKPVQTERLRKTLARLTSDNAVPAKAEAESSKIVVQCFRQLLIEKDKAIPLAWRTAKAQELFAFLLHQRPHSVNKEQLIELLWPDMDTKKALSILYATVYHVRKLLTESQIPIMIESKLGAYRLNWEQHAVEIDVDHWLGALRALEPLSDTTASRHVQCFDLYTGDYLSEHDYIWAEAQREHLHRLWLEHAHKLCDFLQQIGRLEEALAVGVRIQAMDPLDEYAHWQVMKLYRQMNNRQALDRQYELLAQLCEEELGTEIPEEIRAWYREATGRIGFTQ